MFMLHVPELLLVIYFVLVNVLCCCYRIFCDVGHHLLQKPLNLITSCWSEELLMLTLKDYWSKCCRV